jgi:hypothetical protein
MSEPTILPLGLAPEGMPVRPGLIRSAIAVVVGLALTGVGTAWVGFLDKEIRRVEKKFDAAVVAPATPNANTKGCPCCLKTK